ncbi:MAG: alpha/beta fold hydrolase [Humidesulfovibrio sp.]|nr:alpha/beta fold hydrolase [Humidesulfovibrio sp.]
MGTILVAVILFVPALTGLLSCAENRRSGEVPQQRALLRGRLILGLARTFANSAWTLWLTVLALPLGRLTGFNGSGAVDRQRPTVILVHGLYHNPAAWFLMRRRLRQAGFADVRCYGYASFGRDFADIADGLARLLLQTAAEGPGRRLLLLGHSLGGLVIRAACADPRLASCGASDGCPVAGVVTLGAPHRGSTLATMLGLGRLARGLSPGGTVIQRVRALPVCPVPGLSLYSPTDGMVLPLSGAFLDERERATGWEERALPPTSHVGLLYSKAAAREALAFFLARIED